MDGEEGPFLPLAGHRSRFGVVELGWRNAGVKMNSKKERKWMGLGLGMAHFWEDGLNLRKLIILQDDIYSTVSI
jgi:hypothetical protein